MFATNYEEILARVAAVDPVAYGRTRNFTDGAVTRLSPYISRGVISTTFVLNSVLKGGRRFAEIERFVMELAWRDFFQRVWLDADIDEDLRQPQPGVTNSSMPKAVLEAATGVEALDEGVRALYETGYVHNHVRMYIASVVCNLGGSHWRTPARWFYYHLLDADWASNALSWQWTAAAFASKKYFANQDNINKYTGSKQKGTFLDVDYAAFESEEFETPEVLREIETPNLATELPATEKPALDAAKPTVVYNFYNLDPAWLAETDANRVLLLEPSHFMKYPVSPKSLDFALALAANIPGIQVAAAEFDDVFDAGFAGEIHYKEHPTAAHYRGTMHERDWMFPEVRGFYPSFFAYWKKCERVVKARMRG